MKGQESRENAPPRPTTLRCAWEHSHREFLATLNVLKEADARGYAWRTERIYRLGPVRSAHECVLIPYYYDDFDVNSFLYPLRNAPTRVLNLAYEQMHPLCARDYVVPEGAYAREALHYTAWGPRFRELLLGAGIAAEKVHMTGHPRFDLYAQRDALMSRDTLAAAHGLDPDKPWFLFPCNFNFAYVTRKYVERVRARGYRATPEFIAGFAKARDAFIAMITEVALACPDVEIIVRVHPAGYEGEALYNSSSARHPHVHVIAAHDIANWICQSAGVVVWNSTSSMEAIVADVPVVSYDVHGFGKRFAYDVNQILPTFTQADEVVDLIRALPNANLTYDRACFEGWYQHTDGQNTSRILDAAEAVLADTTSEVRRYLRPNMGRRLKESLRKLLRRPEPSDRQPFSQADVVHAVETGDLSKLQHILR